MKISKKYIQAVGDLLIPFCGFFFWEWGLYFIMLFYFLDMISIEFLLHLKSNKIVKNQPKEEVKGWIKYGALSFVVFFIAITMVHLSLIFIIPNIDFSQEAIAFWEYEELGIKQGVLFVPLVFLIALLEYRSGFVLLKKHKEQTLSFIWKKHILSLVFIIAVSAFFLAAAQFLVFSELVYVLLVVVGITIYKAIFN